MIVVLGSHAVCSICKVTIYWHWKDGIATLEHMIGPGLEYCENAGKFFEAPTMELKEKEFAKNA